MNVRVAAVSWAYSMAILFAFPTIMVPRRYAVLVKFLCLILTVLPVLLLLAVRTVTHNGKMVNLTKIQTVTAFPIALTRTWSTVLKCCSLLAVISLTRTTTLLTRTTSRITTRSEEHTSELQSRPHLVCRLLL